MIKSFFCCAATRDEDENTLHLSIFESIPGKIEKINEFTSKLKEKIGIIIIYNDKDQEFNNFIEKLKTLDHLIDVLVNDYINLERKLYFLHRLTWIDRQQLCKFFIRNQI